PGKLSNEHFINALQSGSDVVIQKSIKEGFGLTVTEAMFKGQPVIGGNAGGIKHQIIHQKNGFIVNSPQSCAKYMAYLLSNPKIKHKMGKEARKTVEKNFLMPSLLLSNFVVYKKCIR
ncbi:glycosyltransferase, partial [Candidatus Parcubacteria bacterium]|nr:glycosyltransferase [Candidatus Parcubacteria bacterium]